MNKTLNVQETEGACPSFLAPTEIPPAPLPDGINLPSKTRLFSPATGLLTAMAVFVCLLVPAQGLAFSFGDLGKKFKEAADSVKQHVTDLTQKKVDEGEKKVEEGIDQTVEGEPAPSQQQVSESTNLQQEQQTVLEIQQRLNALGYNAGPEDGQMGSKTAIAIKVFKNDHGLHGSGLITPDLLPALRAASGSSASSPPASNPSSMQSSPQSAGGTQTASTAPVALSSTAVSNATIQQRLNELGYDAGTSDGVFGPKAVNAIKAYQRDHGMAETGQVSPELIAALEPLGGWPETGPSSTSASGSAVPGAQSLSSSTQVAIGPVEFTGFHNSLLGFKYLPDLYLTDPILTYLTQQQIQAEANEWSEIDLMLDPSAHTGHGSSRTPPTLITFTWSEAKTDPQLRSAFLQHFMAQDADWSFLSGRGYDPSKANNTIIQLFLLQRDQYQNRMPAFAAQDLLSVYREFLQAALSLVPTTYVYRTQVVLNYDMARRELTFATGPARNSNKMQYEIKDVFWDNLPPKGQGGVKLPQELKGGVIYLPNAFTTSSRNQFSNMPGLRGAQGWGPAGQWRYEFDVHIDSIPQSEVRSPAYLSLDRDLTLEPMRMEPTRAEALLLKQQAIALTAELTFEVTGARPAEMYFRGQKSANTSVLIAVVQGLRIIGNSGELLLEVPLKTAQAMEQEEQRRQAEAAAQAEAKERQIAAKTESEKQRLEKLRMACYTGEAYPWETTSECLKAAKKTVETSHKGAMLSSEDWEFLGKIEDDQRYMILAQNAFKYELSMACSIGAMRKQQLAGPGAGSNQDLQKDCQEKSQLALEEEKVCPATGPLDKEAQSCLSSHVEALVNKYYGFAGSQ